MKTALNNGLGKRAFLPGIVAVLLGGCLLGTAARGGMITIYYDDFDGDGTSNLHGTAPDVRPGDETWLASTGATARWQNDGTISGWSSTNLRNAHLPFTPQSGTLYRLEAQLAFTGSHSVALGFVETANLASAFHSTALQPSASFRFQGSESSNAYLVESYIDRHDYKNTNHGSDWGASPILAIELDTRGENWIAEWFINGESVATWVYGVDTKPGGVHSHWGEGENPVINYVSFGLRGDAPEEGTYSASISYFHLTVIPEPGTLAIFGLGGLALLALRRRR